MEKGKLVLFLKWVVMVLPELKDRPEKNAWIKEAKRLVKELGKKEMKTIVIEVEGGVVIDVRNLPDEYDYEIIDRDEKANPF